METKEILTIPGYNGTVVKARLSSGYLWTKNCHGDQYAKVTYCHIFVSGYENVWFARVVKHENDLDNEMFAFRLVLREAMRKSEMPRALRKKMWEQFVLFSKRPF